MSFIKHDLLFREVEQHDLPVLRQWRNDPEMSRYWHDPRSVQTMGTQEAWYWTLNHENQAYIVTDVITKPKNALVDVRYGLVRFKLDNVNKSAHMCGMDVPREHRGNGIALKMLRGATEYVLHDLGMHRASCEAMVTHLAAVHIMEQVGYTKEGLLRDYTWSDGRWHTWVRYSMLQEELK